MVNTNVVVNLFSEKKSLELQLLLILCRTSLANFGDTHLGTFSLCECVTYSYMNC